MKFYFKFVVVLKVLYVQGFFLYFTKLIWDFPLVAIIIVIIAIIWMPKCYEDLWNNISCLSMELFYLFFLK